MRGADRTKLRLFSWSHSQWQNTVIFIWASYQSLLITVPQNRYEEYIYKVSPSWKQKLVCYYWLYHFPIFEVCNGTVSLSGAWQHVTQVCMWHVTGEIIVEMVIPIAPRHWKFRISACIILEHLNNKYFDIIAWLRDKPITQFKSSKI